MLFWIVAIVIAVLAMVWILYPLLRPKTGTATRSEYDIRVYKDQLKEVETDLERGTVTEADAKASRTEVSRRLLAAAETQSHEKISGNAPKGATRFLAFVVLLFGLGGSVALYFDIGVPGLPDLPLQQRLNDRPTQTEAETVAKRAQAADKSLPALQTPDPRYVELVNKLRNVLKDRPDDLVGHRMLADNLAQLGQYIEARKAQDEVMRILGDKATANDYATWAEIMIVAADYYVSPTAETALAKALQLDSENARARYYAGIVMLQRGEPARTYDIWNQLLKDGPADAPWINVIKSQIDAVAAQAGITPVSPRPSTTLGPTASDVQAAGQMTPEERMNFIRDRVKSLSDRLASQGGSADEWAQLIKSLGVLGETDKATAVWKEAQGVFANDAAGLDTVTQAAKTAGVAN